MDDIFCKIINGEIPAQTDYRDKDFIVIHDIHPQAPVHLLIIPIKHFTGIEDFTDGTTSILGKALQLADRIAHEKGLQGYRLIINEGPDGGKVVPHLHIHLLGGKHLGPKIVQN